MDTLLNKLVVIMSELRSASIDMQDDPKALMHKYDMLFLGEKYNTIYSLELRHALNTYFKIPIQNDDLLEMLPELCETLNMKYTPMMDASTLPSDTIVCYQVELW